MSTPKATESVVSSARQAINERTDKIFESNIRHTLEYIFGFKNLKYPDKIFIKKIVIDKGQKIGEIEIIQDDDEIIVDIKNEKFKFLFDKSHKLLIKSIKNEIIKEIESENSNKETKINFEGFKLTILPYKEMEIEAIMK